MSSTRSTNGPNSSKTRVHPADVLICRAGLSRGRTKLRPDRRLPGAVLFFGQAVRPVVSVTLQPDIASAHITRP
jgi:hypothetical protein